jgi:hypothetical protein
MKKILKNCLLMLVAGAFAVSCADYNDQSGFSIPADPGTTRPYADLGAVKSYINTEAYPNMSVDAAVNLKTFNEQKAANAVSHSAVLTNFTGLAFGYSFMPDKYVSKKGYMNFMDLKSALSHVESIGGQVFGSPIVANEQQSDEWFEALTAPIEVQVLPIDDKELDYSTVNEFTGKAVSGKPSIVKNFDDKGNALKIPKRAKVWIIQDFPLDPHGYYTITFTVKSEIAKDETVICTFADNKIMSGKDPRKYTVRPDAWQTVKVEAAPAEGATEAYLMIEGNLNSVLYIRNVKVTHTPDNHRDQTKQEKNDTIRYALNKWCDGLMEANAGRIKSFDLIDEPLDTKATLENGMLDLKHSTEKIFWQDFLGSENYAPEVSRVARAAFEKYEGNPEELKFFISETGLEQQKRFESLKYWIGIWDSKGAKIDGINAKLNLTYSEDAAKQAANKATLDKLLDNLASTGKLVRLSNFDIKYQDAAGAPVAADKITQAQRQQLADYYGYVIKAYMNKIPHDKQAGICKGNLADTSDPVGLWSVDSKKDWVRTATYKAFCDALSGQ